MSGLTTWMKQVELIHVMRSLLFGRLHQQTEPPPHVGRFESGHPKLYCNQNTHRVVSIPQNAVGKQCDKQIVCFHGCFCKMQNTMSCLVNAWANWILGCLEVRTPICKHACAQQISKRMQHLAFNFFELSWFPGFILRLWGLRKPTSSTKGTLLNNIFPTSNHKQNSVFWLICEVMHNIFPMSEPTIWKSWCSKLARWARNAPQTSYHPRFVKVEVAGQRRNGVNLLVWGRVV